MNLSSFEDGFLRVAPGLRLAMVSAGLLTFASNAFALWDDQLELFVSETVATDSNVFRISKDQDPNTFLGSSRKDDTYTSTVVGFNVNVPVSRQRFQAGTSWNQVRYNRFSDLNYLGRDSRLLWLWQAGDQLSGQLGYTETTALASFSNFQGRIADPLKTQRAYGNAAYLLNPSWQVQIGLAGQTQRNGNALRQENDVDLRTADVAVSYISSASNKLGIGFRQDDARYPHQQLLGGLLYDNRYTQRGLGVFTDWAVSAKSHLNARVDRVRRSYDQLSQRDYSGTTYNATYDWAATERLALAVMAQRDISSAEDIQTSFVLVNGVSLRPSYELSSKIKLSAVADYSTREYLGDPGLPSGITAGRVDHVRTAKGMISYQALRSLTLQLSAQHESRTSNVPLSDYKANVLSINARLGF